MAATPITNPGIMNSFGNTPQAKDDLFANTNITEDSDTFILDVMADDGAGGGKSLWSLDNGASDPASAKGPYAPQDLLAQDGVGAVNYSAHGAVIMITADGKVSYTMTAASKGHFQYLAAGEVATDTFTYAIRMGNGALSWATATVQITGTNDGPIVAAGDVSGGVTELVTPAGNLTDTGTIAFSDVDLSDVHGVGAVTASAGALGALTASVSTPASDVDGTGGVITWDYSVAASAVEYLGVGEFKDQTFTFTLSDGNGGMVERTVSVRITGTNDGPLVEAIDVSGAVTEQITPAGNLTDTGTIAFSDVDLIDVHGVGAVTASVGALGSLTASVSTQASDVDGTGGEITWDYSVAASAVEYLGAGQFKDETFSFTLSDGNGGAVERTVSVRITGTNDAPVVAAVDVTSAVTEAVTPIGNLTDSGTISFTDVDLTDIHSLSAVTPSAGALGTLTASVSTDTTGSGVGGVVSWNYSVAASAVEYLAAGQTKVENFSFNVLDGNGGSVARSVNVTITGTNDAPVIAGSAQSGAVQEDGQQTASGQFNASDVDHGAVLAWTLAGGAPGAVTLHTYGGVDYNFAVDRLDVTKNGDASWFNDEFDNGVPPPSGDFFPLGNAGNYFTSGVFSEAGGRLIMDGAQAGPTLSYLFTSVPYLGHFAALRTDISSDMDLGLKSNDDFTVAARFDLAMPDENGEAYGIRLTDLITSGPSLNPGDDVMELIVRRGDDGQVRVQFLERDFAAGTTTPYSAMFLSPPAGADQIVLKLSHQAANAGVVTASFDYLSGGEVVGTHTFGVTGRIFGTETPGNPSDDEVWTRAQIITYSPGEVTGSSISGVYGTLSIEQNGVWTYQLNNASPLVQALAEGQTVTDTFTAKVLDQFGAFDTQSITVAVTGTNDAPVAVNNSFSTNEDTALTISATSLLANDTDVDAGDSKTLVSVTNGSHGSAVVSGGNVIYTSAANYSGADSFTYTMQDAAGATSSASVSVTVNPVNDAPDARDDLLQNLPNIAVFGGTDGTSSVSGSGNVANDLRALGVFGSVSTLTGSESLSTLLQYDAILAYTNWYGSFSTFGGQMADYVDSGGDLVVSTFAYQGQPGGSDWGRLETGGYLPFVNYFGNYANSTLGAYNASHPIMSGPLAIGSIGGFYRDFVGLSGDAQLVASWADGRPLVAVDGGSGVVGVTLFPNDYYGTLSGSYMQLFGNALRYAADVSTNVSSAMANEDAVLSISASELLLNDTDIDGESLSIFAVSANSTFGATVTYSAGSISYDPRGAASLQALAQGQKATDSFTYTVSDGHGGTDSATVSFVVEGRNDAPVAVNNSASTNEDTALTISAASLLANDTDVDTGDTKTLVSVQGEVNGSVSFDGTNVTFAPNANYNGAASFNYTMQDAAGATSTATVNVTVNAVNDVPEIGGQTSGSVTEDTITSTSGTLTINDPDAGQSSFQAQSGLAGAYGTLNINAAGNWTYFLNNSLPAVQALNSGQTLADTVNVLTADGTTQAIGITINGQNEASSGFLAKQLTYQYLFSTISSPWASALSFTTGDGVEVPVSTSHYAFNFNVDVSATSISITYVGSVGWTPASFNGFKITDVVDNVRDITAVTDNSAKATTTFDANNIFVNWQGTSWVSGETILINATFGNSGNDPIVLDLNGDGVHFTTSAGAFAFDLDANGTAEHLVWASAQDGVLVMDLNGSGAIENGTEVLSEHFNGFGFGTSMEALRSLDTNVDGIVDARDARFADLQVWRDGNGDGVTQAGELLSLGDLGIVGISVQEDARDETIDGQHVFAAGTFMYASGASGDYVGVNLSPSDGGADSFVALATLTNQLLTQTDTANYVL